MREKNAIWTLFRTFFQIGLFTFGGGYAMLPMIEAVCVERRGWITAEEMLQITVIAESTPGPVAINCATYVGNRRAGIVGATAATLGVVLPSFLVILGVALFLDQALTLPVVANAFRGVKIAVSLLILRAGLRMLGQLKKTPLALLLCSGACTVTVLLNLFQWRLSTVWLLLAAGLLGLCASLLRIRRGKKGGDGA